MRMWLKVIKWCENINNCQQDRWCLSVNIDRGTNKLWSTHIVSILTTCKNYKQLQLLNKVKRCLARYSPRDTTTNRLTKRASNKPAWPGPKWPKNANFGPNLVVFGQKNLFFNGEIKIFVTHITENPPRHLVHIDFWSGIGQNVPKMAIFGQKWPKMHILDQFWPFLGQKS